LSSVPKARPLRSSIPALSTTDLNGCSGAQTLSFADSSRAVAGTRKVGGRRPPKRQRSNRIHSPPGCRTTEVASNQRARCHAATCSALIRLPALPLSPKQPAARRPSGAIQDDLFRATGQQAVRATAAAGCRSPRSFVSRSFRHDSSLRCQDDELIVRTTAGRRIAVIDDTLGCL